MARQPYGFAVRVLAVIRTQLHCSLGKSNRLCNPFAIFEVLKISSFTFVA